MIDLKIIRRDLEIGDFIHPTASCLFTGFERKSYNVLRNERYAITTGSSKVQDYLPFMWKTFLEQKFITDTCERYSL